MFEQKKNEDGRIEISFSELKEKPVFFAPKADDKFVITFCDENGKTYFFKANNKHSLDQTEILAYILRKAMGLPVVRTAPCQYTDENGQVYFGILTESFVKNKETTKVINGSNLMDFEERFLGNSAKSHFYMLENYCDNQSRDTGIYHSVSPMVMSELTFEFHCAFMFMDSDFYEHSIEYLVETNGTSKNVSLAPHVDNSMAFLVKNFEGKEYTPAELKAKLPEIVKNFEYPFHLQINPFEKGEFANMVSSIKNEYKENSTYRSFVDMANKINPEYEFSKYRTYNPNFKFDSNILAQAAIIFQNSQNIIKELTANPVAQAEHIK